MSRRHGGWRKRTRAYIVWTAIALGTALCIAANATPDPPPSPNNPFGHFNLPSDEAYLYVLIFFAWLLGLVAIWAVGWLSDAWKEIADERKAERRQF